MEFISIRLEVKVALSSVIRKAINDGVTPGFIADDVLDLLRDRFGINVAELISQQRTGNHNGQ